MDRPRTCAERHDEEIAVLAARVAVLEALLAPEDHTQQLIENRAWGMEWRRFRQRCEVLYQRRVMTGQWRWLIDSCSRGGRSDG